MKIASKHGSLVLGMLLLACSGGDTTPASAPAAPPAGGNRTAGGGQTTPPTGGPAPTTAEPTPTAPDAMPGDPMVVPPDSPSNDPVDDQADPNLDTDDPLDDPAEPVGDPLDPDAANPDPQDPVEEATDPESNPPVEVGTAPGVTSTLLAPGAEPNSSFRSERFAETPVTVNAAGDVVYVGYNDASDPTTALIAGSDGSVIQIADAAMGGVAATADGVGALIFDPNSSVDDRVWSAVVRFGADGSELFRSELFNSPNLEDVGTKGAPGTSRVGYLPDTDTLVAYFGHTQRYDDGVRHQGGYLALVDASGEQDILDDWFGSHNLDQRLVTDASGAYLLGLGDAYPAGIFFGATASGRRMRPTVIQPLASAGNGATNGQLGGIVDLGDTLIAPFITNQSVPPDLDAGTWPDIDDAVADQIREAASNGTDLGMMSLSKSSLPDGDTSLDVTWLDPALADGASLTRLKAAPLGGNVLLAWSERTGGNRKSSNTFFTMVVDATGAVVQPKASLGAAFSFSGGDDIIPHPNGGVIWGSAQDDGIHIVSLNPE